MSTYRLDRTAIKAVIDMPIKQIQRKFDYVALTTFFGKTFSLRDSSLADMFDLFDSDVETIESIQLTNFDDSIEQIVVSDITLLFQVPTKVIIMKNINKKALTLAHSIKATFSSFRLALLNAYKVLKSAVERERILNALASCSHACYKLGLSAKYQASIDAWLAIWNLDYLD